MYFILTRYTVFWGFFLEGSQFGLKATIKTKDSLYRCMSRFNIASMFFSTSSLFALYRRTHHNPSGLLLCRQTVRKMQRKEW